MPLDEEKADTFGLLDLALVGLNLVKPYLKEEFTQGLWILAYVWIAVSWALVCLNVLFDGFRWAFPDKEKES